MGQRLHLFVFILLFAELSGQERDTVAHYRGGHWNSIDLVFFDDSTFSYHETGDVMFMSAHYEGWYYYSDTALALVTENNFKWLRKSENKYRTAWYRVKGNKILMYFEEQEQQNANYFRDYYTLRLINPDTSGWYKFTWMYGEVIIETTLYRQNDSVWLEAHQPVPAGVNDAYEIYIYQVNDSIPDNDSSLMWKKSMDEFCLTNGTTCYGVDTIIILSLREWNHFDSLINASHFWTRERIDERSCRAHAFCNLSASFPFKSWSLSQGCRSQGICVCGTYLVGLSGIKVPKFQQYCDAH